MIEKECYFYSDCFKLAASLYLPDDYLVGKKLPCIIPNSGYMGLNAIYPALFARALTARGYACLGFDYRGFLDNGGITGVCKLNDQVEDIRNCITFAGTLPEIDKDRIGILGWGMAAGLVASVAEIDKRVKAIAALNGFYCGRRWMKCINSEDDFKKIEEKIEKERIRLVLEGKRAFDYPFLFYPLDPCTGDVVTDRLYKVEGYGQKISLEIGQSLIEFDCEKNIKDINVPVFVGHGNDNHLHPVSEAHSFYSKLCCPKELYLIDGKHNDFMLDDHPIFVKLIDHLSDFFGAVL